MTADLVPDLVLFLQARLTEDEHAALQAAKPGGPYWSQQIGSGARPYHVGSSPDPKAPRSEPRVVDSERPRIIDHIARHDPARTLAEVEAKRQVIRLHNFSEGHECSTLDGNGDIDHCTWVMESEACTTLRLLALPYVDHSDYREEWRP
ncbi:DUF6221 family protein [Streptomyces jeddahensis]|uniref:Uncharacterized protein n=1 Tax=Streptomyces jeddahensis TaxID=1716141 RepID=A0A177HUS0_9ACTN|nr:DUF6221 family protein [Streptomyces jeddahensis]OAH14623.1 hypothetical protein STSP_21340 [Streptomyces jeddahensis]